ncbi:MAG: transposase-like protein [Flavobacteriales bacterium]|jgi:transposase-like protein
MYIGTNERATFWLGVLDDLRNRGVQDMLLVSIDNLKGFEEAIEAIFPKARVQSCVVHQVRNTINYVPYKNSKEIVADVKRIYKATTLKEAEQSLIYFSNKWREKYPRVVNSWNDNWHKLSTYFDYPAEIRKMIYTTDPIES